MGKRKYERILDSLDAEIVSGGKSYPGTIMNFSAEGLHMVTATANSIVEFAPSAVFQLKCTLPSGKRVSMDCKLIWYKTESTSHGVAFNMGMEIEDPPQEYKEFIHSHQSK
jgi:hypothetical protein